MTEGPRDTALTFLGTGNFLADGRYWNSFVLDGTVLVEPSPTCLPNLRLAGLTAGAIDVVVVSHFHADHTFGWPFLLLELLMTHDGRPLHVVGPAGIRQFFADMTTLGAVRSVDAEAHARLDIQYVEVDGSWQEAGPLRFRAVEVDHVPYLRCYGYLFDRGGSTVGYSGDTTPCDGLDELAAGSDVLVLECNGQHPGPSHMDIGAVRDLRSRHPHVPFMLTHMGPDVDATGIDLVTVPEDLQTLRV